MENKYLLLRAIAILFEIAGWLCLILGVLVMVSFAAGTGAIGLGPLAARVPVTDLWQRLRLPAVSAWAAVAAAGGVSLLGFLTLCAIGELILLLLDIEERTRETSQCLRPRI